MIGDTITDDGAWFEVIWAGGELLADRVTKPGMLWTPPHRIYNKKSDYWLHAQQGKQETKTDGQAKL